jgi:hypothetical protein
MLLPGSVNGYWPTTPISPELIFLMSKGFSLFEL